MFDVQDNIDWRRTKRVVVSQFKDKTGRYAPIYFVRKFRISRVLLDSVVA